MPRADFNPVMVEVSRGDMVESCHRGAAAIAGPDGRLVASWGNIDRPVYARSAIKPLQALLLIESGAADRFGLGDTEIALACASHSGQPDHVAAVSTWLNRMNLNPEDLECGAHMPLSERASADLLRAGGTPSTLHNNCSGKHAGFLAAAIQMGAPTRGYIRAEHPIQQRLHQILENMSGVELVDAPTGIDGCGIPVFGLSLRHTATAMARLASPTESPSIRSDAAIRVTTAMANAPFMVAGDDRFCTAVLQAVDGRAIVKVGAEGVYTAALPTQGLGIALKIDDGASRAAEVAIGALLDNLGVIDDSSRDTLAHKLQPPVRNRAGLTVGCIRCADGWLT